MAAAVAAVLVVGVLEPETAEAALRRAAGGDGDGGGGFARLTRYINELVDDLLPVGGAFAALGLIYGGFLHMSGDARGGRVLALVGCGVAIVLLAKPIAA